MRVQIDGDWATLCDGCGTRLDGMENANKSGAVYGTSDANGRFVPKFNICRTKGSDCLKAYKGGLSRRAAIIAYCREVGRDLPADLPPWGHKLTAHIYVEGSITEEELRGRIDAINAAFPDATFIGMDLTDVDSEPQDQVAT